MGQAFEDRAAEVPLLVEDEFEIAGQRRLDRGPAEFAVALRGVRIADREVGAGDRHGVIHASPLADPPIVDVAPGVTRRDRADEIGLGGREPHRAEMQAGRNLDVPQDSVALPHG